MALSCFRSTSPTPVVDSVDEPYGEAVREYSQTLCVDIKEGLVIFISFQSIEHVINRISIDFCLDANFKDIALRLDILPRENKVIRNSRMKREWGTKETTVPEWLKLSNCQRFEFQVFFRKDDIAIALDNRHMTSYNHRMPFNLIRKLKICSPIDDLYVEHKLIVFYPAQHDYKLPHVQRIKNWVEGKDLDPILMGAEAGLCQYYFPVPNFTTFSESFFGDNCVMIISGRVSRNPRMITITLQVGKGEVHPPIIALQMDIRFTEQINEKPFFIFRTFQDRRPSAEFDCHAENDLKPGGMFLLHVVRKRLAFKIYVNNKHIQDCRLHINPLGVNTCGVAGDLLMLKMAFATRCR